MIRFHRDRAVSEMKIIGCPPVLSLICQTCVLKNTQSVGKLSPVTLCEQCDEVVGILSYIYFDEEVFGDPKLN